MREFEHFLIQYERKAFRIAHLATHCDADALDIVQDAMMKLASHYAEKPANEWKPLFFTILQSKIMDWHRKQSLKNKLFFWRHASSEEEVDVLDQLDQADDPENELASKQLGKHLMNAIAALPIQQQHVFIFRTWEDLSTKETAEIMGLNESSVKTHYARALSKLKELIDH